MTTALVTGASSGIGLEIARELAAQKMRLVLTARQEQALQDLAQELRRQHAVEVLVLPFDLAKAESPQQLYAELQKRGWTIDVLVNNAGFGDHGAFTQSNWRKQAQMLQVNVVALTELTHLFLPAMCSRKSGSILNVASTAAFQAGPWMSVYYATKAYVLSFSEAIAEELRPFGVTVTALCPGPTQSQFMQTAGTGKIALFAKFKIPSSHAVAVYGVHALNNGQVIAVHGWMNRLMVVMGKISPRSLTRKIVMKLQESRP